MLFLMLFLFLFLETETETASESEWEIHSQPTHYLQHLVTEDLLFKAAVYCAIYRFAAYKRTFIVDYGRHKQKVERADFLEVEAVLLTFGSEGLVVLHASLTLLDFNSLELYFE